MRKFAAAGVLILAASGLAWGQGSPSIERGKQLFEGTTLGTNGKSCATCHPGGRRLEWAATFEEARLANIVNKCIANPLKGKTLAPDSDDMKSLIMYIKTFAGP